METPMAAQFLDLVQQGKFKIENVDSAEGSTDATSIQITWDESEPGLAWWTAMPYDEQSKFIKNILNKACMEEEEKTI